MTGGAVKFLDGFERRLGVTRAEADCEEVDFLSVFGHVQDTVHQVMLDFIRFLLFGELYIRHTQILYHRYGLSPALGYSFQTLINFCLYLLSQIFKVEKHQNTFI